MLPSIVPFLILVIHQKMLDTLVAAGQDHVVTGWPAEGHEKEKTVLEEELRILTNNMKSLEVARDKSSKREEVLGERLKLLSSKSKETEARALTAEAAAEKLQDEVVKLQDDLRAIRQSNEKTEEEMESFFQDLRNL